MAVVLVKSGRGFESFRARFARIVILEPPFSASATECDARTVSAIVTVAVNKSTVAEKGQPTQLADANRAAWPTMAGVWLCGIPIRLIVEIFKYWACRDAMQRK